MKTHLLDPRPDTVHWGHFDAALPPVLTVRSGDTVRLRSVSGGHPELPTDPSMSLLADHVTVVEHVQPLMGPHILTGPVAVEEAEPGDVLEVRIEAVELIQNWGWNTHKPKMGTLPERFPVGRLIHIPIDVERGTARCPWGTELTLKPFFGVMGVAPAPELGRLSSVQPREFGGNVDNRELGAGATLFLPVFNPGALFSAGDGHAIQGDGEVNLTALETALTGTFTLIVHKQRKLARPRAQTATHYLTMAFDPDLDVAASTALSDMIDFLQSGAGLSADDAYSLCSLACDLRITQLVDGNKGVHAMIERKLLPPGTARALAGD